MLDTELSRARTRKNRKPGRPTKETLLAEKAEDLAAAIQVEEEAEDLAAAIQLEEEAEDLAITMQVEEEVCLAMPSTYIEPDDQHEERMYIEPTVQHIAHLSANV